MELLFSLAAATPAAAGGDGPAWDAIEALMQIRYINEGDLAMRKADFIEPGDVAIQIRWGVMEEDRCDLYYHNYPFDSFLTRKGKYGWYVVLRHHVIDYVRAPGYYPGQEKPSPEKLK